MQAKFRNLSGFLVLQQKTNKYDKFPTGSLVRCVKQGFLVSSQFMFDSVRDCDDEDFSDSKLPLCKSTLCGQIDVKHQKCFPLFYKNAHGTCKSYTETETPKKQTENVLVFKCHSHITISAAKLDDLVSDCGPQGEDEPLYWDLAIKKSFSRCEVDGQLPCKPGHSRCYGMSDICVYQLSKEDVLIPC